MHNCRPRFALFVKDIGYDLTQEFDTLPLAEIVVRDMVISYAEAAWRKKIRYAIEDRKENVLYEYTAEGNRI